MPSAPSARTGKITGLECVRVEWKLGDGGRMSMVEMPGSELTLKADLVLLAMALSVRARRGWWSRRGVTLDARGNVAANTNDYKSSEAKIFACGDMRRGQSLVVWAIREGRPVRPFCRRIPDGLSLLPR